MDEGLAPALQEAAWQVYAVPAADFVATRTAWVRRLRKQGLREVADQVAALRKPGVAAAAINAMVRSGDEAVPRLLEVGTRLRHAQSALDVTGLAALRAERDAVLQAWVAAADATARAAGGALGASAAAEVRDTGVAALADAAAAEVATSGTLTRALAYSGFGEVDLADAVARTSTGVVLTRLRGGAQPAAAAAAGGEQSDAGSEAADDRTGTDAEQARADADEARAEAQQQARLQDQVSALERQDRAAARAREAAGRQVTVARQGVEQALRLLEQAREHQARADTDAAEAEAEATRVARELAAARDRLNAGR